MLAGKMGVKIYEKLEFSPHIVFHIHHFLRPLYRSHLHSQGAFIFYPAVCFVGVCANNTGSQFDLGCQWHKPHSADRRSWQLVHRERQLV
jgi:hypothetical protein